MSIARSWETKIVDTRGRHLRIVRDGWQNELTGHRTSRDKTRATQIEPVLPSTNYQEYEDIYHGDDLGGRMVDELVEDMLRKDPVLSVSMTDDASTDENVEAASAMMTALDDLDAKKHIGDALTWARVFGGSLVFIGADDGGGSNPQSMAQPLRENSIRDIRSLDVYDRWDVQIETEYTDPLSPKFGQPELYRVLNTSTTRSQADVPDLLIHETRTLRFDGVRVNKRRLARNGGWHDSAYIRVKRVLSDFDLSWSSAAHLLADFAPLIFKSPGLEFSLAQDGDNIVLQRMQQMDMYRSTVRMMPIDEGEELSRQTTPIAGMDAMLDRFILRLCAATRMPVTKLFGQSPSGLNSTAEGDLTFWYDRVEAHQIRDLKKQLLYLVKLLWLSRSGPTNGVEPASWGVKFPKLWQMSELEETQAKKNQSETDNNYIDSGVLMPDEVAESRFGGDSYSFETRLNLEARETAEPEPEPEPEPTPMPVQNALPFAMPDDDTPTEE
jgi:phage-related protein (TIGR01555 family)